jgi:apolipoprotein N-acyltransferase
LVAHVGYGVVRLAAASDAVVPGVHLRIVQPALAEADKWRKEKGDEILKRYLEMSDGATSPERSGIGSVTHLIWPESAFPFLLTERPDALAAIAALLPPGTTLITGAARRELAGAADPAAQVFNSVYVIDDKGEVRGAYDKVNLVPFGEYLPLRSFFEALRIRQMIALPGGFAAGTDRRTLDVPGAPPAGPLICYEVIFPAGVIAPGARPGWLVNLTNDTWFGDTPGPRQHLLQAQVRSVEEGLPLVRAANSGISAIVDAYGRVRASLALGQTGILDGELPVGLGPTLYASYGDRIPAGLLVLALLLALSGQLTSNLRRN